MQQNVSDLSTCVCVYLCMSTYMCVSYNERVSLEREQDYNRCVGVVGKLV